MPVMCGYKTLSAAAAAMEASAAEPPRCNIDAPANAAPACGAVTIQRVPATAGLRINSILPCLSAIGAGELKLAAPGTSWSRDASGAPMREAR
jgi:hypothetical protein